MLVIISILQVLVLLNLVKVHGSPFQVLQSPQDDQVVANNFKPSIAVVIGILSIMFSLTFLLLLYAKYCRRSPPPPVQIRQEGGLVTVLPIARTSSGIDKTVIQSLPFFRFSLLKGSKQGLECAVCLSRFEDVEVLRLLPKCKHAFHINCIDQWLEKHSSCPLCRHKVSAEDKTLLTHSNSFRFLMSSRTQSELREDSNLELYVQREENRSSRFSIGSISFKKSEKGSSRRLREDEIPIQQEDNMSFLDHDDHRLHKFNHRIVVSDVVLKHRWSNVSSSDFMFLNSEMIRDMTSTTSNRFLSEITTTTEGVLRQNEKRSMSEILICPRFDEFSTRNCCNREEKRRKLWVPNCKKNSEMV